MDNKINEIQNIILSGFTIFYGITLAINAIEAVAGRAELAVWHYGPFLFTAILTWAGIPKEARHRIAVYTRIYTMVSKQVARKVAVRVLEVAKRALRSLPALFSSNRNNGAPERERCNL